MRSIQLLVRLLDGFNHRIGQAVSWLSGLLVLVVCYDVFTRYFLRSSSVAVQELEWHIFAVLFLLGAAYTLKEDCHVRVDVIYSLLPPRGKALIDLLGSLLFLIPFALLLIWSSQEFIGNSFIIRETSPDPGGLPCRYLLKAMIPAGFFFLLLQGISLVLRSFLALIGKPAAPLHTPDPDPKGQQHV
jgi:TRAP-type mannitol/chloroaromatic compound transport system permease small subunit